MKSTYLILFTVLLGGLSFLGFSRWSKQAIKLERGDNYHRDLPEGVNDLFAGSGKCGGCHGPDPQIITSVDDDSVDVNVTSDWRSTMMANSAKDPFWRAKVSHETLVNPGHATDLETKCTSCHAPLGHFNALHNGQTTYSISEMVSDSIALDGVSCSACHQLDPDSLGKEFSGNIVYDTNKIIWGQYQNPFPAPMQSLVGFDVQYGAHVGLSEMCASCHTLITSTVDLSGNYTGDKFVEQATYHEWLNSQYASGPVEKTCQSCHMPSIDDSVKLALDYGWVGGRSPYSKHHFAGSNVFMLKLLKNNMDSLGVDATATQFDSTISRTLNMLQKQSMNLSCIELNRQNDTAYYEVEIENLAGHKLTSGYPSRRIFMQFIVLDSLGDTLFKSGTWDGSYEVLGHDANYEPHYDVIRNEDEVQIYELVFGDVNGNKTTILERGYAPLKDNRIPPKGFSMSHFAYDTTEIAGLALADPNFNWDGTTEGTGIDKIYYNIGLDGYTGDLNVICRSYYQTAPPAWMVEMFSHSSYEIDRFRDMFDLADKVPTLMKQVLLGDIFVGEKELDVLDFNIYPNPANSQLFVDVEGNGKIDKMEVYSLSGRHVMNLSGINRSIDVSTLSSGTYILRVLGENGKVSSKRFIVQH